jgi:colanic acid/amylovoran biosynthesis protein
MRQFAAALFNADLVVLSGCGLLADPFAHNARQMLDTLGAAQRAGIPTALLSQGLGPMTDPGLRSRAAAVLPHAGKIFLREPRAGLALLRLWGVAQTKIAVTGDDTVELAFNERPGALGSKIGVNLRLANYAGADLSLLEPVRQVLRAQAHQRKTSLLGLPITRQGPCSDVRTLGELLGGLPPTMAEVVHVQTPLELIRRVAECRVVITGSYHAAVFALAQGIPAVALAQSAYYRDKFCGLAELFGSGCEVLSPDMPSFNAALNAAVQAAWEQAPALRPRLLAAAQNQIQAAQQAYQQLPALLSAPSGLPAA